MSTYQLIVLLAALTTVVLVTSSDAISCYQCHETGRTRNYSCSDEFKNSWLIEKCSYDVHCFKANGLFYGGINIVGRGCRSGIPPEFSAHMSTDNVGCSESSFEENQEIQYNSTICLCDKDFCNFGQHIYVTPYVTLILLLVLVLLFNYRSASV
jgi:hypothetical protein